RRGLSPPAEPAQHFRTYFIALTTNTYSTMHYDVPGPHKRHPLHELHAALQDSPRRPPPSGVEQRHHLLVGCREVDRDAVGDGDGEQKAHSCSSILGTAASATGCSRSSGGGGRWRAEEGGPVISFRPLVRSPPPGPAAAHRSARTPARSGRCCGSRSRSGRPAPRAASPSRPECRDFPPHP